MALAMLFLRGTRGDNHFGPDPLISLQHSTPEDQIEVLIRLAQLHAKGILTDEEFAQQKAITLSATKSS
jgi:hypothetical protein